MGYEMQSSHKDEYGHDVWETKKIIKVSENIITEMKKYATWNAFYDSPSGKELSSMYN